MEFYTYILYSKNIDSYYVGHTGDSLEERLRKHNTNHKGYTGKTNDWAIVYKELYVSKTEAYARERYIKKQKSRVYIEQLISSAK
ncbi:GIY-YIG nuclease family protein [Xanthomarina sp. F1114]|uniref:GIY-YIG nuclease family protein n=1 Tax=Xanthomarina sp. F1114 TaxID=2996019 RepID=UPI00225E62CF|nr:GIY-YIG nuclease family protein [Xanthomarina sp. F1114]MCX7548024.1 GIY-YIG nuclease family protein [Xanthomarina sp. F1114]